MRTQTLRESKKLAMATEWAAKPEIKPRWAQALIADNEQSFPVIPCPYLVCVLVDLFIETFHRPPKMCLKLQFYLFTATHSEKSGNEVGNWNQIPHPQAIPSPWMTVNHSLSPHKAVLLKSIWNPAISCRLFGSFSSANLGLGHSVPRQPSSQPTADHTSPTCLKAHFFQDVFSGCPTLPTTDSLLSSHYLY